MVFNSSQYGRSAEHCGGNKALKQLWVNVLGIMD